MFKQHEKFWAFIFLGAGILILAGLAHVFPSNNKLTEQVTVAAVGAFTLALGAATNALFRIRESGERGQ